MNNLRKLREEKKLSLRELGKELNMNASVLGNYERGDRSPKIKVWEKLAEYFNVSVPYIMGLSDMNRASEINEAISSLKDKSNISDGSHTFEELYQDRAELFAVICNQNEERAWKSWLHDDGTMYDDYFIVGVTTEQGDFSYHYHKSLWSLYDIQEVERAPEWDGHTREEIKRLRSL